MNQRDGFGSSTWLRRSGRWAMIPVCILAMGAAMALRPQQAGPASPQPGNGSAPNAEPGAAPQAPGATRLATTSPPTGGLDPDAPNAEHREQIAADSARLVKLAAELKAEVDKSNKDTLSVSVIRKAEEIEKLAHSVKEKTRLAGPP